MENDKLVGTIILAVGIVILAPIVINGVIAVGNATCTLVATGIDSIKYHQKIKKGLKDGSIVKIDGHYYEVVKTNNEEA